MLLSISQPRNISKEVNQTKAAQNTNENFVITIDLQKPVKVLSTIFCCLEAGLINGKKYDRI